MRFKVGDYVRLKPSYVKWLSENADEAHGYPTLIRETNRPDMADIERTIPEQLAEYFVERYSYERGLEIHGVVCGHGTDEDCILVWYWNELGSGMHYIEPDQLEKL